MIRCLSYFEGEISSISPDIIEEKINNKNFLWIDLESPTDSEIKILSDVFKFHPLTIEDCLHKKQRSKVEDYRDYYFIVMNVFKGRKLEEEFRISEIFLFVSQNYIVTVHWGNMEVVNTVFERTRITSNIFGKGIDFLLYNLADEIIDDYFPIVDEVGNKIDEIEAEIFEAEGKEIQSKIFFLKKNMLKLRKIITAQREVLNTLLRHDFAIIKEENKLYFMDVYDHIMRLYDFIDTYHDLLTGTLDLYMSYISNRMNGVMKTLTIIATIIMPLTLISGIYGMNFKNMPELNTEYGYFVVLTVMGIIAFSEILYFKRKGWW